MATSGSIDFSLNRNQLIKRSFKILSVIEGEETPDAEMVNTASEALDLMGGTWQAEFGHIWKRVLCVLFLEKDQAEYDLGAGSSDHATLLEDQIKTEVSTTALVASDTAVTVDSTTDMATSDVIGIVQDDDTTHWTTIATIPSSTTLTLAVSMVSAAAVDNHVYTYTTLLPRPLKVPNARRRDKEEQDIPIYMISHQEYWDLPNKTTTGIVVQMNYSQTLSTGTMEVWPSPSTPNDRIIFTGHMPLENFGAATDDPDFPQEWLEPIAWGLSLRLAGGEYPVPDNIYQRIVAQYTAIKATVRRFDVEEASVFFMPDERYG